MDSLSPTTSLAEVKAMLRIIAAIVAHEGPAYLPLLKRLKRDYDAMQRNDPTSYALKLLEELTD